MKKATFFGRSSIFREILFKQLAACSIKNINKELFQFPFSKIFLAYILQLVMFYLEDYDVKQWK